jgi:leucyl aminopeptidase
VFAKRILKTLPEFGVKVTVFDQREIKRRKMGGLLAVGSGSANPPRFIILNYKGAVKNKKSRTVVLVGKGITFDSGGISIKPASNMGEMKADMSGAAVVAGTILAAAKAKLPVNIVGVIPSAENMPSGSSMRPGDIVVTASGKSIEVDNTDAEGRMILADALDYASKLKPDVIIDLATLTGACIVALGEFAAGLFTKDEKLADALYQSGLKTYDRLWRLPMWDDYNDLIKSDVADVKNVGGRWGGAITAAKFLEKFVDNNISWAHLDIAGPAMANSLNNYTRKFMTGFGVRLLFDYLANPPKKTK